MTFILVTRGSRIVNGPISKPVDLRSTTHDPRLIKKNVRRKFSKESTMRADQLLSAAVAGLLMAGCAGMQSTPAPEVRQALAPTGKLRVGVYPGSPFSLMRDPATGETRGVAVELGRELAKRLGVPFEMVEY